MGLMGHSRLCLVNGNHLPHTLRLDICPAVFFLQKIVLHDLHYQNHQIIFMI